jgi:hypothetical protein
MNNAFRLQEEDEKKKVDAYWAKKSMKQFLDHQVDEKMGRNEFDKLMNSEQARIWKKDTTNYYQQEKEINEKVYLMLNL